MPVRHYDREGIRMTAGDTVLHVPTGNEFIYLAGLDDGISSCENLKTNVVEQFADDDLQLKGI